MNKLHAQDSLSNQFFAVVDGGGGVAEASASGDVAVVAVRQLCYAFRDKEILELAGLEGSLAILDDDVAERGVEVQSSRAVDGHADPSAAGTSRHSANEQV